MKTDPKQHDYVCESGASRNYEPWRDIEHAEKILKARSQLEDEDAMKRVEGRVSIAKEKWRSWTR
jgi:hypothetical protein